MSNIYKSDLAEALDDMPESVFRHASSECELYDKLYEEVYGQKGNVPDEKAVEAMKETFAGIENIEVETNECNFGGCPMSRAITILKELVDLDMTSQSGDCNEIREKAEKLLSDIGVI